jgi:hypothetical protein
MKPRNPPPKTHTLARAHTVKYFTGLQLALCVEEHWNPQTELWQTNTKNLIDHTGLCY